MKKIHIPRKVYIIVIASFFIVAAITSAVFFFTQTGEKWYSPVEINRIENGDQYLQDIEINEEDHLIYVSKLYRGVDIYDIENISAPVALGSYNNLENLNRNLFYAEDRLYLMASSSLYVIDVSNPNSPALLGNLSVNEMAQNVHVAGNYAYLVTYNWFKVLDVSDPTDILVLYSRQLHFGDHDIFVRGNFAFVASNLDGLMIFNIATPSSPQLITSLDDYGEGAYRAVIRTKAVDVQENILYIVDGVHGLVAFDITSLYAPVKLFKYVSGAPPDQFAIRGDNVYYPNYQSGVEIVDVSDPENVQIRGTTPSRYLTIAVVMYGEYAVSISKEGVSFTDIVEGSGFNPWKTTDALHTLEGVWKGIGAVSIVSYLLYRVQKSDLLE